jgi:hypothetical protein
VFPPEAPAGLVAAPGFVYPSDQRSPGTPGLASEGDAQKPAIDLSWDPNPEPRVAGYRVYRRDAEGGEWKRLEHHPSEQRPLAGGPELRPQQAKDRSPGTPGLAALVREASYRDATVVAGRSYAYRVTAVSEAGNESGPGNEVTEIAPAAASSGP